MRPQVLDDIIGQDHIVGHGRLLRRAIQADRLSSLIFYGPPGTGKTSLARVIANTTSSAFESLNAVLTGIKDIREAIDRASDRQRLYGRRTILFVDEVHRWNKAQQDGLLPWVENGTVILIGATTENPFFEVNRALVSRSRIFQLKPLENADLMKAAQRAVNDKDRGYGKWKLSFEDGALEHLVEVSSGDARSLLNALELAVETSPPEGAHWSPPEGSAIHISLEAAEESIQRRALLYDRDGDYHFDTISAFIKSVRGSDPDAALYWLAKMVRAGEDPAFIFRRMIILAMEDVGLADPSAITTVISCAEAFKRLGFPEGNFALSQACLRLATAAKSNTTLAFFDALAEVEKEDAEVPNHLRDASRDAESFGHGEGYVYPHAYRDHWAAQQYLPDSLRGRIFYTPSCSGDEARIRDSVLQRREIQAAVILSDAAHSASTEALTWSAAAKGREGWFKRLESNRSALLLANRDAIFARCSLARHDRVLIAAAGDGLLLWESLRRTPEGLTAALVDSDEARETLVSVTTSFGIEELPLISIYPSGSLPTPNKAEEFFSCRTFDHILAREPYNRMGAGKSAFEAFAKAAALLLTPKGTVALLQSPPLLGERISRILTEECNSSSTLKRTSLAEKLARAEEAFFSGKSTATSSKGQHLSLSWDGKTLQQAFIDAGFAVELSVLDQQEERLIPQKDLAAWFAPDKSSWGSFISTSLDESDVSEIRLTLEDRIKAGPLTWKWRSLLLKAVKQG